MGHFSIRETLVSLVLLGYQVGMGQEDYQDQWEPMENQGDRAERYTVLYSKIASGDYYGIAQ